MVIRDNYHPFINKLFRKYSSKIISLIMNLIVGMCCFILLAFAFLGLAYFLSGYGNVNKILSISGWMIFIFCFLTTIKTAYSFLYCGKDLNFLRTLPVTRLEIIASNVIYFYRKQVLVSLFFTSAALYGLMKFEPSCFQVVNGVLLGLIIPLIAIFLSILLAFLVHLLEKRKKVIKNRSGLVFLRNSVLVSLLKFEIENFRRFASLKMEIVLQLFCSAAFTLSAIKNNTIYLAFVVLYPALSMVNVSSFSREGELHNMLETLPIEKKNRIMAKVVFYLLIELPILLICFLLVSLKKNDMSILLQLIPGIFFLVNITMVGIKVGSENPKIHWTNPQDAFQMNFVLLLGSLLFGLLIESMTFLLDFWGVFVALVINVFVLLLVCKCLKK